MEDISNYPKEIQDVIKSVKVMNRDDVIKYYDNIINYYIKYNEEHPNMTWAKDYPRNYIEKKYKVLREFDEHGIACYHVDYNHYGHGFDCKDIDVYLYTDGTYKVSHHSYSAY